MLSASRHKPPLTRPSAFVAAAILASFAPVARAEILSSTARAEVELRQFRLGVLEAQTLVAQSSPGDPFPLRPLAGLDTQTETAAALGGAQFFAPTPDVPNPESFALSITCDTLSPSVSFFGRCAVDETREIVFDPNDVVRIQGTRADAIGTVSLDGVLAIYATNPATDLSGAEVSLFAQVDQIGGPDGDQTAFQGEIVLVGLPGGQVTVQAAGEFPTSTLILTDLAPAVDQLGVFWVLIIPNIVVRYDYSVNIGEPTTLRVKVESQAINVPDGVGATGLLGSPTDTLLDLIGVPRGPAAATKMINAIQAERARPSGRPVFEAPSTPPGFCGLLGLEAGAALVGLSLMRRGVGRPRLAP